MYFLTYSPLFSSQNVRSDLNNRSSSIENPLDNTLYTAVRQRYLSIRLSMDKLNESIENMLAPPVEDSMDVIVSVYDQIYRDEVLTAWKVVFYSLSVIFTMLFLGALFMSFVRYYMPLYGISILILLMDID